MPFDWRQFHASEDHAPAVVEPRRRLRICLAAFVAMLALVLGRAIQLEATYGPAFRDEALRPAEKKTVLPAPRGRILSRDGAILACDQTVQAVAVQYRWLQDPPDDHWLRTVVRSRLSKTDRRNVDKLATQRAAFLAERADTARRLADLCGLSPQQWAARSLRIQTRVERIAQSTNSRRELAAAEQERADDSWTVRLRRLLLEEPPPPRIVVAEELNYHVMAEGVPAAAIAEIEAHPDLYPGVRVVSLLERSYPAGSLAAHVLGHLGRVGEKELAESADPDSPYSPDDWVGRMGIERQYETLLRGHRGLAVQQSDRSGRIVASFHAKEPAPGQDIVLGLDSRLQRTTEELLQGALERRTAMSDSSEPAGGAIVVMDLRDGAIRAAASAPAFDPNLFVAESPEPRAALLTDPSHPMFDRVCQMALPPGSTFKLVTAVALLESATVPPAEPFTCQGYLHQPDRQRCQIYMRQGIGHGEVTLADALAVSCNVYFFHFAGQMGPRPLIAWAARFGFGCPTGIDLPGESAGVLATLENIDRLEGHTWTIGDTQSLAIGQGSLTATPLQVLRMIAAVATAGHPPPPHLEKGVGTIYSDATEKPEERSIPMQRATIDAIRDGLRRAVADAEGTAHATVFIDSLPIAGKTGTAETGPSQLSHAWFAGYVPANQPKLAFVIVLEHAGDAAATAGPVVKRLVLRMDQLGML